MQNDRQDMDQRRSEFPRIAEVTGVLPDLQTQLGKAWNVFHFTDPKERMACIASWVVWFPGANLFWGNYTITAVHLRDEEGLPPATIFRPEYTHEVHVYALDPSRAPNLRSPRETVLHPINFCGQWAAASDIDAEEKIARCVQEILDGALNPDTDFRHQWVERFSDSNIRS